MTGRPPFIHQGLDISTMCSTSFIHPYGKGFVGSLLSATLFCMLNFVMLLESGSSFLLESFLKFYFFVVVAFLSMFYKRFL
jgi:hypothetical protein